MTFRFWNYYFLKLLHLETMLGYVLSQYRCTLPYSPLWHGQIFFLPPSSPTFLSITFCSGGPPLLSNTDTYTVQTYIRGPWVAFYRWLVFSKEHLQEFIFKFSINHLSFKNTVNWVYRNLPRMYFYYTLIICVHLHTYIHCILFFVQNLKYQSQIEKNTS